MLFATRQEGPSSSQKPKRIFTLIWQIAIIRCKQSRFHVDTCHVYTCDNYSALDVDELSSDMSNFVGQPPWPRYSCWGSGETGRVRKDVQFLQINLKIRWMPDSRSWMNFWCCVWSNFGCFDFLKYISCITQQQCQPHWWLFIHFKHGPTSGSSYMSLKLRGGASQESRHLCKYLCGERPSASNKKKIIPRCQGLHTF